MPVCVRRERAEPVDGGWPGAERERPGPREGYESILHKMRSHWEFNSVLYFNWKMVDLQCASAVQKRFSHACVCSSLRLLSLWFTIG